MQIFIFLALLTLIVIFITTQSTMSGRIAELSKMVDSMRRQIHNLNNTLSKEIQEAEATVPTAVPDGRQDRQEKEPVVQTPPVTRQEPVSVPQVVKEEVKPVPEPVKPVSEPVKVISEATKPPISVPKNPEPKIIAPPKQTFFERNPDLEKFIGENLINKIGIAILVLGIAFFVRYAISKEWIGPIGRASIGILCGGILIALAHRLRKSFAAFSSVLVGGGLAVLYFTITICFHEYHLFSQSVAFVIMVLITTFSVILSISYNRVELAILALIGGFTSPFLLSTGEGNYIVLFTYVAILNSGILTLAFFKKWNILNIISFGFTVLLYTGWFVTKVIYAKDAPYIGALTFVTLFYVQFFLTFIINNVLQTRKFNFLEIGLLLGNTFLYFAAGIYLLEHVDKGKFNGLFTLLVACINCIFAFALYKRESVDKNLVYLLIGLVLTFISLAAPIQLRGNQITMFWAAESVLLLWLAQKSKIKLMKKASVIILVLMFMSLFLDLQHIYFELQYKKMALTVLFNKGFMTGIVVLTGLLCSSILLKRDGEEFFFEGYTSKNHRSVLNMLLLLTLYAVLFLELHHQLHAHIAYYATIDLMIGSFNFLYLLFILAVSGKTGVKQFADWVVIPVLAALLSYPVFYHHLAVRARNFHLVHEGSFDGFLYHYLLVILILVILYFAYRVMRLKVYYKQGGETFLMIYTSLILLFLASAELDHTVVLFNDPAHIGRVLSQNHKIGFPILWGVCSFVLMFLGMRYKKRELRLISLSLFLVILLKLFIFDIRGMSEGGKIAAFIFLGIILLVVSFMYQKLKKLVLDDDHNSQGK